MFGDVETMLADIVPGFVAGLVVASLTTPVGVSGAILLLPIQLSIFGVPPAAVPATNLLFNVVAVPGALWGYRGSSAQWWPLTRLLLFGAVPGVVMGATLRVLVVPDGPLFRVLVAALLAVMSVWLLARALGRDHGAADSRGPSREHVLMLGAAAGGLGGIFGIGGGSICAPVLVLAGLGVAQVAAAALATTLVTSLVGAATFAVLCAAGHPQSGALWGLGVACGVGGLIGGYVGARLQPRLPKRALLLGLAVILGLVSAGYLTSAA